MQASNAAFQNRNSCLFPWKSGNCLSFDLLTQVKIYLFLWISVCRFLKFIHLIVTHAVFFTSDTWRSFYLSWHAHILFLTFLFHLCHQPFPVFLSGFQNHYSTLLMIKLLIAASILSNNLRNKPLFGVSSRSEFNTFFLEWVTVAFCRYLHVTTLSSTIWSLFKWELSNSSLFSSSLSSALIMIKCVWILHCPKSCSVLITDFSLTR